MAAVATEAVAFEDMEAFLRVAKYTLVKHTDMHPEMKDEVRGACCVGPCEVRPARLTSRSTARTNISDGSGPPPRAAPPPGHRYGAPRPLRQCSGAAGTRRPWTSASRRWKSTPTTWRSAHRCVCGNAVAALAGPTPRRATQQHRADGQGAAREPMRPPPRRAITRRRPTVRPWAGRPKAHTPHRRRVLGVRVPCAWPRCCSRPGAWSGGRALLARGARRD